METIILFVDDAVHARDQLSARPAAASPVHWVVVACAPRMTHRISKWVSHSARANWRAKWFAKTMDQLRPLLEQGGSRVSAQLAMRTLTELVHEIRLAHAGASVVDARRPKVGADLEPVAPDAKRPGPSGWKRPGTLAGMGALLFLANSLVLE